MADTTPQQPSSGLAQTHKRQVASQPLRVGILERLEHEAREAGLHAWAAFASFAWLWPVRGILYAFYHPHLILSVRYALVQSLVISIVVFAALVFFTFLPQMAVLAVLTGPLAPLFAVVLVGAEAIILIAFFGRALFLEPALTHVFDATLDAQGQKQLLKEGKARAGSSAARDVGSHLVKPLQGFSQEGVLRHALTLPLNFIPMVGTPVFLLYNGQKTGPAWHSRYFALKGLSNAQRSAFVEKRRAEYTAFGMMTLLLNFVPLVGLVFSFTNTIGAAMWAAQLEAEANIIDREADPEPKK
ncbi:transporter [Ganoderma sinense ZZ0214-1]|uniref:Transporter n=1 Tax=Ganoderma sinense ZZ0214-1 TaxID=1077348 RepID=A0A2G8RT44_9APHY|nr:transporter [Ganoderma sinense ZZ0214-1]